MPQDLTDLPIHLCTMQHGQGIRARAINPPVGSPQTCDVYRNVTSNHWLLEHSSPPPDTRGSVTAEPIFPANDVAARMVAILGEAIEIEPIIPAASA